MKLLIFLIFSVIYVSECSHKHKHHKKSHHLHQKSEVRHKMHGGKRKQQVQPVTQPQTTQAATQPSPAVAQQQTTVPLAPQPTGSITQLPVQTTTTAGTTIPPVIVYASTTEEDESGSGSGEEETTPSQVAQQETQTGATTQLPPATEAAPTTMQTPMAVPIGPSVTQAEAPPSGVPFPLLSAGTPSLPVSAEPEAPVMPSVPSADQASSQGEASDQTASQGLASDQPGAQDTEDMSSASQSVSVDAEGSPDEAQEPAEPAGKSKLKGGFEAGKKLSHSKSKDSKRKSHLSKHTHEKAHGKHHVGHYRKNGKALKKGVVTTHTLNRVSQTPNASITQHAKSDTSAVIRLTSGNKKI